MRDISYTADQAQALHDLIEKHMADIAMTIERLRITVPDTSTSSAQFLIERIRTEADDLHQTVTRRTGRR